MPREQESVLRDQLNSRLINQVIGVRQRRRVVEQNWLRSRRTWMNASLDRRFVPSDSSPAGYNIPAGRRAAERTVVRGVSLLTPNVKWFEVSPASEQGEKNVHNMDKFMWYILRKRIKSRSNINLLIRSMFMYGLCHLKTSVTVKNNQVWPSQRVVDPFAFYIFPETAATTDEAELVFEDFLYSYEKYNGLAQRGMIETIQRSELTKPDWPYHLVERLAYQGITDPTADVELSMRKVGDQLESIGAGFVSLTEMWLPHNDKLYQVYIAWNLQAGPRIVSFVQSEYDEPLYRSVIHRPLAGETYTNSMMDDISELNNIQNDLMNQFIEAVDWEQGFVAFNTQASPRMDSLKMKGRAKWEFGDDPKQAMAMFQPNVTSPGTLRALQIAWGLINSLAGTGTMAEGQPGRNMPRAGGAVNNLITLSMADIQDLAELVEQEVLTPSLSDIYKVSSQFIPESQLMRIPGGTGLYGSIMKREQILGDYDFEWIGSLQFQDESMRSQRLLIFLNMMPQLAPYLQQQGYMPNMVELVKLIWRYGLGERGLSDVIVPIEQLQQTEQQPGVAQSAQAVQNGIPGLRYSLPTITDGFVKG